MAMPATFMPGSYSLFGIIDEMAGIVRGSPVTTDVGMGYCDDTGVFVRIDAINHDRSPFPAFQITAAHGDPCFSPGPLGQSWEAILKLHAVNRSTGQDAGGSGRAMQNKKIIFRSEFMNYISNS